MSQKFRLPILFAFITIIFALPVMVRTVLSAEPTPPPKKEEEYPLAPEIELEENQLQLRTLAVEPGNGGGIPATMEEIDISQTGVYDYNPHLAYNPDDEIYLVIWHSHGPIDYSSIYGIYMDREGNFNGESFLIAADCPSPIETDVFYGNGIFLVIWREGENFFHANLQTKRVSGSPAGGRVLDPEKILIHDDIQEDFTGTYDPIRDNFLILWQDPRHEKLGPVLRGEIFARRISLGGELLGEENNLTPFENNPGVGELGKILSAPSTSGDLSIAHNPNADHFLITYSNYKCTNLDCTVREDMWAFSVDGSDLSVAKDQFGITTNILRKQWQGQVIYHPDLDEFLVIWSDNRYDEDDFNLRAQKLTGGESEDLIPTSFFFVQEEGNQNKPQGIAIPSGDPLKPAYAVIWLDEISGELPQVQMIFLDLEGKALGIPQIPSYLPGRDRTTPDLAVEPTTDPKLFLIWSDHVPYHDADIHGRLLDTNDYFSSRLQSPLNFTMVLSLYPTIIWDDVPDAAYYKISIYPYGSNLSNESGQHLILDASFTPDDEDPTKHSMKFRDVTADEEGKDIAFHSGSTLTKAAYFWKVTALDEDKNSLGTSLAGVFQIPPLGLDDRAEYAHWNDYDDYIYEWSERWDLPPNLYKAVLASESRDMHNWFDLGPNRGYLYEAMYDLITCRPNALEEEDFCRSKYMNPFYIPDMGYPDPLPGNNGLMTKNPSIAQMMKAPEYAYLSNTGGLANFTGCPAFPLPTADNNALYSCVADWFENHWSDFQKTQFRTMAGYGLCGVNYWTNIPILYPNYPNDPIEDIIIPPETLYDPKINIGVGSKVFGDKRCWWHNAAHAHPPYDDPINGIHEYLSAQDYRIGDYERWRQIVGAYAGFSFHHPQWYGSILQVNRVEYRFKGSTYKGKTYAGTYMEDLSGYADLGVEVDVQIEDSPQQYSKDKTYGDSKFEDVWDSEEKRCPYPGYFGDPDPGPGPQLSLIFNGLPSELQSPTDLILASQEVDFQDDLDPEWVQLVWEGTPGVHTLHQAKVRIYDDQTLTNLIWESPPIDGVSQFGIGRAVDLPGSIQQIYQVEMFISLHSSQTFFVEWDGSGYRFIPFIDLLGLTSDHLVSTGGGATRHPDGTISLLNRGLEAGQTDVTLFELTDTGYIQERSYTFDENVTDTRDPLTTFGLDPISNPVDWIGNAALWIIASDYSGVAYLEYSLSGATPAEKQRSYLKEVRFPLEEGRWTLRYHATDIYGNVEPEHQFALNVDQTPPATFLILDGTFDPDGDGFRSSVEVLAASEDPLLIDGSEGSGVAQVEYSLDQGLSWLTYPDPLIIEEVGSHEIWVRGVDHAGNQEEPIRESFEILPYGITIQPPLGYPIGTAGKNLAVGRTFQDTDLTATHTGTFQWGDGTETTVAAIENPPGFGGGAVFATHIYQDVGIYNATLIVTNNRGVSAREDFPVTIYNPPPEVEAGPDQEAQPGEVVQFNGSFTDPAANDNYTITWRFGDGATAEGTLTPTHSFAAEGIYEVILQVDDDEGDNGSDILVVTVINRPPEVDLGEDQTIDEGDTFTRTGSFSDPGLSSWTGEVDYGKAAGFQPLDLNSDNSFDLDEIYLDNGIFTIKVRITDDHGLAREASLVLTVNNRAPSVEAGAGQSVYAGDKVQFSGSFNDPGIKDTHTVEWDFGDEETIQGTLSPTHIYTEPGPYTVTLTVTDDDGGVGSDTLLVQVEASNQPPQINPGGHVQINEGDLFTRTGSFTDPDSNNWTGEVDYGLGAGIQPLVLDGKNFTLEQLNPDNEVYTVTVRITDEEGASDDASFVVTVTNVAPKVGEISAPGPVQLGNEVQVEAPFTDPGQDSWMATWDWGDGNQNEGTIADFLVSGEHTYQNPGLYLIEITVTDDDGGEDSAIYVDQVIYDQEGGFITGGGWIQSPVGAYPPAPELTGKANFNLNLKYKKKAAAPSGNNKFDFKEGDLDFKATDYLWLVVDGNLAIMRGDGEVNKQAGYGFLISVIDGKLDKIRIKIWEQGSGLVVYDNQPGDPDEADPITELGGGSIVIHK